eukprot:Anaeramoba_ignava/c20062_g1_i2.p1 GENE.c20062_g1_i2~~c20062_g1_i2.p1  ORF type:complete len:218 (+),score=59.75 c20062_g1_i2:374-1027(+)
MRCLFQYHSSFIEDMQKLYEDSETCDLEVQILDGKIGFHKLILQSRIGYDYSQVLRVLQKHYLKSVSVFKCFLYTGQTKKEEEDEIIKIILEQIGRIDLFDKDSQHYIINDLTKMWEKDDETKDFTIKVGENQIRVHRTILIARSDLYRGMFISVVDDSAEVHDYSQKSFDTVYALIQFFYTEKLDKKNLIVDELYDAIDYYQLNANSMLRYFLNFD